MKEAHEFQTLRPEHEALLQGFYDFLSVEQHDSPHTVRAYQTDTRAYLKWCERNDFEPLSITHQLLRLYLAELDAARYERSTINRHLSALKGFYQWLIISRQIDANPAAILQGPKQTAKLPRVVSASELEALLNAFVPPDGETPDALSRRNTALLEFLYACGARVGEAATLTCDRVDFSRGLVQVIGKGNKERIIPLHALALERMSEYLRLARSELLGNKNHSFFFVSTRGNALSTAAIRRVFKEALRRAGIDESLSPHAMRHTFATDVLSGGADLRSVQEMLGHASLSTTQIYTHLTPKHLKETHRLAHPRS